MDDPLFSAGSWLFRVSVFSVLYSVYNIFRVYHTGTRGEESFPSRMEEIGIRELDR